ncbi:hypothetical protein LEP1GSC163_0609 [Leptospira santarosai str. CBC379]|uniref:Uncharacterized protein n=1 Tax=Leptospira santarosai str. MOR084 TaxID=1049984 RepID=A0A0E2BL82_9LEPT|nr:hypothetical protein LEP1GSC179_1439 [Leptospira santarosai str. MOR084]EKR91469.1 hypothetical protein LEP1GSC163_0609 [Leptospira santarosai str. CBC379]
MLSFPFGLKKRKNEQKRKVEVTERKVESSIAKFQRTVETPNRERYRNESVNDRRGESRVYGNEEFDLQVHLFVFKE